MVNVRLGAVRTRRMPDAGTLVDIADMPAAAVVDEVVRPQTATLRRSELGVRPGSDSP